VVYFPWVRGGGDGSNGIFHIFIGKKKRKKEKIKGRREKTGNEKKPKK
jgi:hypothetical protein